MTDAAFKVGDVAGYIFAQPGNDTTYLVVTEVRENDVSAWDCTFDLMLKSVPTRAIWHASERELASGILKIDGDSHRSYTIAELAAAAKLKLGFDGAQR